MCSIIMCDIIQYKKYSLKWSDIVKIAGKHSLNNILNADNSSASLILTPYTLRK